MVFVADCWPFVEGHAVAWAFVAWFGEEHTPVAGVLVLLVAVHYCNLFGKQFAAGSNCVVVAVD